MIRRRFRVEGTPIGNSHLLMKSQARNTALAHGGKVVEVIPFTSLAERQAQEMPVCGRCEAAKGKPCKSSTGKLRTPHMVRWAAFNDE